MGRAKQMPGSGRRLGRLAERGDRRVVDVGPPQMRVVRSVVHRALGSLHAARPPIAAAMHLEHRPTRWKGVGGAFVRWRIAASVVSCVVPGCSLPVAHPDRIPLCSVHLAVAADTHDGTVGVPDLLPSPCTLCGARIGVRFASGWACGVCEWPHGEHPDSELPRPRVDVVYYLRRGDLVKIGTTSNPRQRFGAIRHDELLALERGDRRLEQRRHLEFAEDRGGTSEWFALSRSILSHIDVLAGGVDPWDRWRRWVAEATAVR